ncbi:hypothetical protein ACQY0O_007390 [Thecaphora frezii]
MGLGSAVRGGLGFLNAQHHDIETMPLNQTPSLTLGSLLHRPREMPLPLTPLAVLRSLVQFEDLQAFLWAWMLVGIISLIAYWSNPSDASFRPFLTDFTFRERLRCLHEGTDADALLSGGGPLRHAKVPVQDGGNRGGNVSGSAFKGPLFSTSPFATTFGSKLSLSVRTPPYVRKDFGIFSLVTISHSMPLHYIGASDHDPPASASTHDGRKAAANAASDYTSVFIGAFGHWWTAVYGLPLQRLSAPTTLRAGQPEVCEREELEENRHELSEWGVLEMRSADHEHSHIDPLIAAKDMEKTIDRRPEPTPERQPDSKRSRSRSSSPHSANRAAVAAIELEASDISALVTAVTDSQSAVSDLQEQLKQLRANSAKSCEGLQGDVDELRARKREEDKSRMEIRSRTRSLEESKRQAEQARREAERRLKAATAARTSKQNSITSKREEIEALLKKRAGHRVKLQLNATRKAERIEELRSLTTGAQDRLKALKEEVEGLRVSVRSAEDMLSTEKDNLQAAYDGQPIRDMESHGKNGHGNAGFGPQPPRDVKAPESDPFGALDAGGKASTAFDGFRAPAYIGSGNGFQPPMTSVAGLQHAITPASPYNPFSELPDVPVNLAGGGGNRGFGQFAPLLHERRDDVSAVLKASEGLGAGVLRNAFRKATGAASFAPKGFADPGRSSAQRLEDGAAVSNFEAMKQAFQPTLASEEEGRRSWSAFDIWQSDIRDARHRLQWSNGMNNDSADSLPQFHQHASSPSSSMLVPLDRSNSAGYVETAKDESGLSGDAEQMRNLSKVKRAFRWPFRPNQIQGEVI